MGCVYSCTLERDLHQVWFGFRQLDVLGRGDVIDGVLRIQDVAQQRQFFLRRGGRQHHDATAPADLGEQFAGTVERAQTRRCCRVVALVETFRLVRQPRRIVAQQRLEELG